MKIFIPTYALVSVSWTSCLAVAVYYGLHGDLASCVKFGTLTLALVALAFFMIFVGIKLAKQSSRA